MSRETREQLIDSMSAAILVDRAATHGLPEDSFVRIAELWSAYLYSKLNRMCDLSPSDVAMMMALMKIARAVQNPAHLDNYVDAAGYMILAGEPHV